jgi:hypothetical protein
MSEHPTLKRAQQEQHCPGCASDLEDVLRHSVAWQTAIIVAKHQTFGRPKVPLEMRNTFQFNELRGVPNVALALPLPVLGRPGLATFLNTELA